MAAMMMFTSCSEEELVKQPQAGDLAKVSIKVTTPELGAATRAFGDGKTAQTLHYAVYAVNGEGDNRTRTYLDELTVENHTFEISTTVDLQLVTGNTYDVIFWADADTDASVENNSTPYSIDWENASISVDYNGVTSNNEAYDAFFNWMTIDVDAAKTVDIDLFRPFAQLNIGTSDIVEASKAGYTLKQTQVTVKAYQTLNLWDKKVSDPTDVTFNAADYPNYDANADYGLKASNADGYEIFPVTGYEYMAMNYLLCPADKELVDVEFDFFAAFNGEPKERKYASVPVRRNWRTNIYGQLITSDVDVNVEIVPAFEDAYDKDSVYNRKVWDGHTLTAPKVAADGTILVGQGAELAYIANVLNGGDQSNAANNGTRAGSEDYTKAKIVLTNNIDLGGENWNPIKNFEGTFDGAAYTISNLKVNTEGNASAGLFASVKGYVKNLTVKDADIKGHYKTGVIVGDGLCSRIENCHVENAKVLVTPYEKDYANHVGGIVGYLSAEREAYVKGCSVKNAEITAYRDVAGVVGTANQTAEVSGCTVENVTVTADQTSEYKEVKDSNAGAIVGRIHANAKVDEDNTIGEGVEVIVKGISATDLKNLVAEENATINLGAGTYVFPGISIASGVTINCAEGTVFEGASSLNINGATVVGATFSNPRGNAVGGTINGTFKNCTFTGSNALRDCYAGETVFFENCVFDGDVYGVHFDGGDNKEVLFKNCTFSGFNAFAAALELVTFDECTFKANGKSGYNGANLWGSAKMINTNFEFDGTAQTEWIDAIGADKTYEFNGCTINGASILNGDYFFSRNVGTKVTVDGVEYTRAEGGYWANNGAAIVATANALKAALANGNVNDIYLSAGTTFEGKFEINNNKNLYSDKDNQATIKGRVEVSSANPAFNNITFDRNETDSNEKMQTASNALQYKAVVMIYGDQSNTIKFEECKFLNNNGTHKSAITNVACELIVDKCYFEGYSSGIYSQANLSITNSTFNYTGGNNVIASINGCDDAGGKFIFRNNVITNKIFALSQFLSTVGFGNGTYHFDVQGNTGEGFDHYFLNEGRVANKTFAEGSETF